MKAPKQVEVVRLCLPVDWYVKKPLLLGMVQEFLFVLFGVFGYERVVRCLSVIVKERFYLIVSRQEDSLCDHSDALLLSHSEEVPVVEKQGLFCHRIRWGG